MNNLKQINILIRLYRRLSKISLGNRFADARLLVYWMVGGMLIPMKFMSILLIALGVISATFSSNSTDFENSTIILITPLFIYLLFIVSISSGYAFSENIKERWRLFKLSFAICIQLSIGALMIWRFIIGNYYYLYSIFYITVLIAVYCIGGIFGVSMVIRKSFSNNKVDPKTKKNVVFLRGFKTRGDHIFPIILLAAVGGQTQVDVLSSTFFGSTLLYMLLSFSLIWQYKGIFRSITNPIRFHHCGGDNWEEYVEKMISTATRCVIDLSGGISDGIKFELNEIKRQKRDVDTLFLFEETKKETVAEKTTIDWLKDNNIDFAERVYYYPQKFPIGIKYFFFDFIFNLFYARFIKELKLKLNC